jgi:carboxypeptidase Q
MKSKHFLLTAALALTAVAAQAQGDPATIERLIHEGKNRNQVMRHLEQLTKDIGSRLTGSPSLSRAEEWAMRKFREFGLTNVHRDYWGDVPVGFERGPRQSAKMIAPFRREFEFTTPAWTAGTNGPTRGRAVAAPATMAEFEQVKDKLRGAWVIMPRPTGNRGAQPEGAQELERATLGAGILGRVYGSANERIQTGGRFTGLTMDNLPKEVRITVRKSDMDAILMGIRAEREVILEFDIENRFLPGPVRQYNIVADIKGTEKPDEIVIVSGHLDSWDGPGSQGACDNGTGSVVTIEAARLLMASGAKPKRTIRFILWTGEEQGLLGSRSYVNRHKDLHEKISAVFVDDGGTNYHGGYDIIASMAPMIERAMAPTQAAFPDLPMENRVRDRMPTGGSSDHAPFNMVGIPGFFTIERGRADYGHVWHTQNDRYEEAIPEYLIQSSTNAAIVAYNIASADTMLPRGPKPDPRDEFAWAGPPAGGWRNYYHNHSHDGGCDHLDDDFVDFMMDRLMRVFGIIK